MATVKGTKKKTTDEAAEKKTKTTKSAAKKKTDKTAEEKTKTGAKTVKKKTSPKAAKKTVSKKPSSKVNGKQNFKQYEGKTLVVVESPAKAKTLEKILGSGYKVLASVGHVRDLPKGRLAIDIDNDFEPDYIQVRGKADLIRGLKGASQVSKKTLLASDPDREGEAIAWHLLEALGISEQAASPEVKRVTFHEITKGAIQEAIAHPGHISRELVDAQQARSVLDYLVGFNLSPFLWKKIRYGLSAGRVQSVALRLICEREKEIEDFVEQEYWTIAATLEKLSGQVFKANLVQFDGKKLGKFDIPDEAAAEAVKKAILGQPCRVKKVAKSEKKRNPSPPFTTSTLQQEAARKLGFSAKKTMATAQKLYEGIDIGGEGTVGLITYMRTDSVNLSSQALKEAHEVILSLFGPEYALEKPRHFKNKSKNAQEAHEAIRPTYLSKTPAELKKHLTPDQFKLYDLIWKRTIACQMTVALLEQTTLICVSGDYSLKQSGAVVVFDGWGKVFPLGVKDADMKPAV